MIRAVAGMPAGQPRNAATFDLEDWHHGIEGSGRSRERFVERLHVGATRLLDVLEETRTTATFFVLGCLVARHGALIREIADRGHELATHGFDHDKIYEMAPERWSAQLERAKKSLEDVTGRAVVGHRAPFFSITRRSLWAIDVLEELGFQFDASIYPGRNWRYGIPETPDEPYLLQDTDIVEFPVSTFRMPGGRIVGIGGAYFRILPFRWTRAAVRRRNAERRRTCFYLHPWELDPGHPRVAFKWRAMVTHYANLHATESRLRRLLMDQRYTTMGAVVDAARRRGDLERVDLQRGSEPRFRVRDPSPVAARWGGAA